MRRPALMILLLWSAGFALATYLTPRWGGGAMHPAARGGVLELLLGEGRQLIANHLATRADVYFHNGYYPSIFDRTRLHEAQPDGGRRNNDVLGVPRDWLDRFSRNFYPSRHTHLGERGDDGAQREMLPWLRLSVLLDPHRVESYTVAAYWLASRLKRPDQAEAFLREGWRANPDSYEILFELGRLAEEQHHDTERARNLWELALRKWTQANAGRPEPDLLARRQVLAHLARLEERAGNLTRAIEHLEALQSVSPNPAVVRFQIEELRRKLP